MGQKPQGALVQVDGALALLSGEAPPLGTVVTVEFPSVDTELGRIDVRWVSPPPEALRVALHGLD